jgi:hypothetical protein
MTENFSFDNIRISAEFTFVQQEEHEFTPCSSSGGIHGHGVSDNWFICCSLDDFKIISVHIDDKEIKDYKTELSKEQIDLIESKTKEHGESLAAEEEEDLECYFNYPDYCW